MLIYHRCKSLKNKNWNEFKKRDEEKRTLQANVQEMKNKLEFANSKIVDDQMNATKQKIKDLEKQLKTLTKEKKDADNAHRNEEKEYQQIQTEQNGLADELTEQRQAMTSLKKKVNNKETLLKKLKRKLVLWNL